MSVEVKRPVIEKLPLVSPQIFHLPKGQLLVHVSLPDSPIIAEHLKDGCGHQLQILHSRHINLQLTLCVTSDLALFFPFAEN